jgi:hypothetical protein
MQILLSIIKFRDLFWQIISPAVVATSIIWLLIAIRALPPLKAKSRILRVISLIILILTLVMSLEPIYGYFWDMKCYMKIL